MSYERKCRECQTKTIGKDLPTKCRRCGAPFGPLAFGLDRDRSAPTGLTQHEKDADLERRLRRT